MFLYSALMHLYCRSPPQSKASPVSMSADGIEPVSPPGAISEPETPSAAYPNEQAEQGYNIQTHTVHTQMKIYPSVRLLILSTSLC